MADSTPIPKYIYKLIPSSAPVPDPLPESLGVSDLDQKSGFIHLSTALQVPGTLKHFFTNEPLVYVLRLEYALLEKDLRWEDPKGDVCGPRAGEGMFAHLYNGLKVGRDEVDSVAVWERGEGGWDAALKRAGDEGWLVY